MSNGALMRIKQELVTCGIAFRTRLVEGRPTEFLVMSCCNCGAEEEFVNKATSPTEYVVKRVERAGWKFMSRHHKCPECAKKEREKDMKTNNVVAIKSEPQIASKEVLKKQRELYDLLDSTFDVEAGRYNGGGSDEALADLTGLSKAYVAEVREAAYGPIKVDQELLKLAQRIAAIEGKMEADMKAMRDKVMKEVTILKDKVNEKIGGK